MKRATRKAKTVSIIFGTRPEAIKLAPIVLAMRDDDRFRCDVCVTGQHRQMLDQVLEAFCIAPDSDLNLMRPEQSLAGLTSRAVLAIDEYINRVKPDLVLVQGDTTTVLCASLAAFYNDVCVGHVEAGLRTGNLKSPWPEEANRVLTSHIAQMHFAPTEGSKKNLLREGIEAEHVWVTGNTAVDALFLSIDKIGRAAPVIPGLPANWKTGWQGAPLVLITGHRRESFGDGFEQICKAIARLADDFPQARFVYPVHLNPNVRRPVQAILDPARDRHGNIFLIEPLGYLSFVDLLQSCTLALTDSGGVQEEAPSLGKPVLVMRDTTERPEAVDAGTAMLVGAREDTIVRWVTRLLTDDATYQSMARAHNPYGDGKATARILAACASRLGLD